MGYLHVRARGEEPNEVMASDQYAVSIYYV